MIIALTHISCITLTYICLFKLVTLNSLCHLGSFAHFSKNCHENCRNRCIYLSKFVKSSDVIVKLLVSMWDGFRSAYPKLREMPLSSSFLSATLAAGFVQMPQRTTPRERSTAREGRPPSKGLSHVHTNSVINCPCVC